MIAASLLQRVEANWEKIAEQVLLARNQDPELPHYKHLSRDEVRERVRDLTTNLSVWLTSRAEGEIAAHYENLGGRRYREEVPLHEVIQKLIVVKRAIRRYASEQNYSLTAAEIYDELELLRAMAAFFDMVTFRVAKGYAEATEKKTGFAPEKATTGWGRGARG